MSFLLTRNDSINGVRAPKMAWNVLPPASQTSCSRRRTAAPRHGRRTKKPEKKKEQKKCTATTKGGKKSVKKGKGDRGRAGGGVDSRCHGVAAGSIDARYVFIRLCEVLYPICPSSMLWPFLSPPPPPHPTYTLLIVRR